MEKEKKLTTRQLMTISHLINSSSIEEASQSARVSRTTIYKWLKDDCFNAELKDQRDEMIQGALDRLKWAITKATTELIKLMDSTKEETRRLACKDIIEYALRSIELEDIEQRLNKVERIILERKSYR